MSEGQVLLYLHKTRDCVKKKIPSFPSQKSRKRTSDIPSGPAWVICARILMTWKPSTGDPLATTLACDS